MCYHHRKTLRANFIKYPGYSKFKIRVTMGKLQIANLKSHWDNKKYAHGLRSVECWTGKCTDWIKNAVKRGSLKTFHSKIEWPNNGEGSFLTKRQQNSSF